MECRRVQSQVLSFTSYIQPTFQPYSPNTPQLVTSMLMMCKCSSMVHFLISSLLLATLMLSLSICTSECLPIGSHLIQIRQFIWFGTAQQLLRLDPPCHREISLFCLSF